MLGLASHVAALDSDSLGIWNRIRLQFLNRKVIAQSVFAHELISTEDSVHQANLPSTETRIVV